MICPRCQGNRDANEGGKACPVCGGAGRTSDTRCSQSACREPILFGKTIAGQWTPLDAGSFRKYMPAADVGAMVFVPSHYANRHMVGQYVKVRASGRPVEGFTSHHATCLAVECFRAPKDSPGSSSHG